MGKRGPNPTPTAILKGRGSWRGNRKTTEPKPEPGAPGLPKWLGKAAKVVWKHVIPQLEEMGVLAKIDMNALARYCTLFARWKGAETFIAKHKDYFEVKSPLGQITDYKPWPQVKLASQLADQCLRLEQQFGMTPSARAGMAMPMNSPPKKKGKSKGKRNYVNLGGASA